MNKLSNIGIALSVVANPLAVPYSSQAQRNARRYSDGPSRMWSKSKRWQTLRAYILARDNYTCQEEGCGILLIHKTHLLVAHHKKPHKGDAILFWDKDNIETVCKQCHDGIIQSREKLTQQNGG